MSRAWRVALLTLGLAWRSAGAADCAVGLPGDLASWTALHLGFEHGLAAATAQGERSPRAQGGKVAFAPGRVGSALRLGVGAGGARVDYASAATLDLTTPGSLAFWVAPAGWSATSSEYVPLLVVAGSDGATLNLQRDFRAAGSDAERFLVGLFALPGGRAHFVRVQTPRWEPGSWHLVALRWDRVSFGVSIDGQEFVQHGVPSSEWRRFFDPRARDSFWRLGSPSREGTLIDDFRVFARPLTAHETRALSGAPGAAACRGAG